MLLAEVIGVGEELNADLGGDAGVVGARVGQHSVPLFHDFLRKKLPEISEPHNRNLHLIIRLLLTIIIRSRIESFSGEDSGAGAELAGAIYYGGAAEREAEVAGGGGAGERENRGRRRVKAVLVAVRRRTRGGVGGVGGEREHDWVEVGGNGG